jgi:hypothetical protein
VDDDFMRDRKRSSRFTVLLMIFGIIALVVTGLGAFSTGEPGVLAAVMFVLAIVTAIVWAVVYVRTRKNPEEMTAGRVAQGVVVTVGAFVFGYIVIALSVGLFLLAACAIAVRWH